METFLTDSPADADIKAVNDALNAYNVAKHGPHERTPLAIFIRDENTHQTVGGLSGMTALGLLFVDLMFVPESARGTGLGGGILRQAEQEAVRRGCTVGFVYTLSFQAPDFYAKQGWKPIGEITSTREGVSRHLFTKELV
jgi:GNAT superfamily N-acetyltransferase